MERALYDQIGRQYTSTRRPDPRIAVAILDALGDAHSVVTVGAGAGAYEPVDRSLVAVEPSWQMIRQRPASIHAIVRDGDVVDPAIPEIRRFGHIRSLAALDVCYRLLIDEE